jgi:cation transport regulator ChaC
VQDLWIFGYGSLRFKADFPYVTRQPATLPAWNRRFWQASTDHRGTPEYAGRVVTLIETPGESCWGMAYQIAASNVDDVLTHLDYREKGGYRRLDAELTLEQGHKIPAITYHADQHNPEYLGAAPLAEMAQQIVTAVGPSGANKDYLFSLESSLKQHEIVDEHVFELANAVRSLLRS